ncbi:sensor histidine kinase [Paenibacillus rhizoplanae]
MPEAELYATITRLKETLLLASFVLLILVIIVALWLSTGITKPLSAMARAMRHVRNGQFELAMKDMPKVRSRQSEVDYVAGVFEQMTRQLKYLIETEFETNLRRKKMPNTKRSCCRSIRIFLQQYTGDHQRSGGDEAGGSGHGRHGSTG